LEDIMKKVEGKFKRKSGINHNGTVDEMME
jgi:hypothetical protein